MAPPFNLGMRPGGLPLILAVLLMLSPAVLSGCGSGADPRPTSEQRQASHDQMQSAMHAQMKKHGKR